MRNKVVLVRHSHGGERDHLTTGLEALGYRIELRKPFAGETLGLLGDDVAATVVYGGGYNADSVNENPFLRDEYQWIDQAMQRDVPLLGICQGAQMIAHHMGAWAGAPRAPRCEWGIYPITPTAQAEAFLSGPLHVVQAHFHTFDLPPGAVHLARSTLFENQAFRIGTKIYGVQFHPEQTAAGFTDWQQRFNDLWEVRGAQTRAEQSALLARHQPAQKAWLHGFLQRFVGKAPGVRIGSAAS